MARLFGTDGVRGVVNEFLTPELAIIQAVQRLHILAKKKDHPTFLIGRDTRISGSMLESALASGICSVGGNVVIAGVIPTQQQLTLYVNKALMQVLLFLHLTTISR